MDFGLEPNIWI